MIRSLARGVMISVAGGAVALSATVAAQAAPQAATTSWRIDQTIATRGRLTALTSVAAVSRGDAWAAGFSTTKDLSKLTTVIRHWAGRRWLAVKVPAAALRKFDKTGAPTARPFGSVAASSARNVWDFGEIGGVYIRLEGRRWAFGRLPGMRDGLIDSAVALSPSDVWVFGGKINPHTDTTTPYAANFDGDGWTSESLPGSGVVISASAVSAGDIWAVVAGISGFEGVHAGFSRPSISRLAGPAASTAPSSVVRWNGTSWQAAATQPALPARAQLASIVAESDNDVWVGGGAPNGKNSTTYLAEQWNGTSWTADSPAAAARHRKYVLVDLVPDGSGGLWALATNANTGFNRLWHLSGGSWAAVTPRFGHHQLVLRQLAWVPGTKSVWAAGIIEKDRDLAGLIAVEGPLPR
jgi:hypothetical protein